MVVKSKLYKKVNDILRDRIKYEYFHKVRPVAERKRIYKIFLDNPINYIKNADLYNLRFKQGYILIPTYKIRSPIKKFILDLRGDLIMEDYRKKLKETRLTDKKAYKELKAKKDEYKRRDLKAHDRLITDIKQMGFLGLTLNEINSDMVELYKKVVAELQAKDRFDKEDINKLYLVRQLRRDEMDLMKFMVSIGLKEKEINLKYGIKDIEAKANKEEDGDELE